jgi:sugar lactone lactonase YvrE
MKPAVELAVPSADSLGECPLWDGTALWWVDIHGRAIKRFGGKLKTWDTPEPVGSIAFRKSGGLLAAMQTGLFAWNDGQLDLLMKSPTPELRFNDGRCDPAGRFFWVGTLKDPSFDPVGSLYCFSNTLKLEKTGIKVPNSTAWSPDGKTMYFADSPLRTIWAYDYDAGRGTISRERVFARTESGFPDGSCVDADACLWNAEYGGSRVVRYTPQGKVDRVIDVPTKNPTCCCFGGADLKTLYITAAGGDGVYALQDAGRGLPESIFSK